MYCHKFIVYVLDNLEPETPPQNAHNVVKMFYSRWLISQFRQSGRSFLFHWLCRREQRLKLLKSWWRVRLQHLAWFPLSFPQIVPSTETTTLSPISLPLTARVTTSPMVVIISDCNTVKLSFIVYRSCSLTSGQFSNPVCHSSTVPKVLAVRSMMKVS